MSCLVQLGELLQSSVRKHRIPGAALAVWHKGELYAEVTGLLNTATGVEVTRNSVFQIGSIAKLFTATLCMQLVEQGRFELDKPVYEYMPAFGLADMTAAREITLRHLLSHSSGMAGDIFLDTGDGADRFQRLIDQCRFLPLLHPVGEKCSYCNVGWAVAARLAEIVSNQSWDELMHDHLFEPLGLENAFTHPADAIMYRTAIGHVLVDGDVTPTTTPYFPTSGSPMGSTPSMSVVDLIRFARMALGKGDFEGKTLLRKETAETMYEAHSFTDEARQYGLGWGRWNSPEGLVLWHDGATPGQSAFLRVVPAANLAIALLINRENSGEAYFEIAGPILQELAGISIQKLTIPDDPASVSNNKYEGVYDSFAYQVTVFAEEDRLFLDIKPGPSEVGPDDICYDKIPLVAASKTSFYGRVKKEGPVVLVEFEDFDGAGIPAYLRFLGRLFPRTDRPFLDE